MTSAFVHRHVAGFGETNLVGNVYFSHFVAWQGRCREEFLRLHAPSVIEELGQGLALVTTRCACEYVDQVFALDEVEIEMRLAGITDHRVDMTFHYYRLGREGGRALVAVGSQQIACMRATSGGLAPARVPVDLAAALAPYASTP